MRFRIDLKIFIIMILFYLTGQIEIYAMIMFFCILHELGHVIAGVIAGMKPDKIEIMPFGLSVSFKIQNNKKKLNANIIEWKKIIVAICGPITNLLIILFLLHFKINHIHRVIAIYSNILIMLFNILPIYPLDGGRILKSIIHIFCGEFTANIVIKRIAIVCMILLSFIGSISIYYFENIAIFLVIIFLWWLVIYKNNRECIND